MTEEVAGININKPGLIAQIERINELDELLGNTAAAGKTKLRNTLIAEQEAAVQPVVTKLSEQIKALEGSARHGAFFALIKGLEGVFGKEADEFITKEAEAGKTDSPALSEEERQKIFEERKDLYQQAKITADVLKAYKTDLSDVQMPAPTKGSVGPKVREISKFQFRINDVPLPDDKQSVTSVAEHFGYADAKSFKAFLKENNLSLGKADLAKTNGFKVTMPNGEVLSAVRQGEQVAEPTAAEVNTTPVEATADEKTEE